MSRLTAQVERTLRTYTGVASLIAVKLSLRYHVWIRVYYDSLQIVRTSPLAKREERGGGPSDEDGLLTALEAIPANCADRSGYSKSAGDFTLGFIPHQLILLQNKLWAWGRSRAAL